MAVTISISNISLDFVQLREGATQYVTKVSREPTEQTTILPCNTTNTNTIEIELTSRSDDDHPHLHLHSTHPFSNDLENLPSASPPVCVASAPFLPSMAQRPAPVKSTLKTTGQSSRQTSIKVSNTSNIEALMHRESGLAMIIASVFAPPPHLPIKISRQLTTL